MQKENNNIHKKLSILFWFNIVTVAIIFSIILFLKGPDFGNISSNVAFERWAIIITIAIIPLTLKGYHFLLKKIKEQNNELNKRYTLLFITRLLIFNLLAVMNIVGFEIFEANNFIYLTIVTIFAMVFCLPSRNDLSLSQDLSEEKPAEIPDETMSEEYREEEQGKENEVEH